MTKIEHIIEEVRKGGLSPGQLAEFRLQLSGEYAFICGMLEEIEKKFPDVWLKYRQESGSDAQADKKWQSTVDGMSEKVYKLQLKKLEKIMSAINTRLRIAEGESRNIY